MKPLVVIPARGGSKRLPKKNIKLLNDKPLIQYTIEAAKGVFNNEIICVSTDDKKVKEITEQNGLKIPFSRPPELATDSADSRSVILHAYEYYKKENHYTADVIILLQPTSPLRKDIHIKEAFKLYHPNIDMVVSVKKTKSNPYVVLYEENKNGFIEKSKKIAQANSFNYPPDVWELNGAIYIINIDSLKNNDPKYFKKIVKYVMKNEVSIDIDNQLDWWMAEILIKNNSL